MKKVCLSVLVMAMMHISLQEVKAQGFLNKAKEKLQNIGNGNANSNHSSGSNESSNKSSVKVNLSPLHKENVGKIRFLKSSPNPNVQDNSAFVTTLDLNQPSSFNVYLDAPLNTIKEQHNGVRPYQTYPSVVGVKYYIADQLIAQYTRELDPELHKNSAVYTEVIVPANKSEFLDHEKEIGVLAYVFSGLTPGTHQLKIEYNFMVQKELPNTDGSAATTYDNTEKVIASGTVDIKIDAESLRKYCLEYGRPKFSKGVLQGEAKLEQQVADLIYKDQKIKPIYIYGSDNWDLKRGALDRVIGREAFMYYVYKDKTGRCSSGRFIIHQTFDGVNYQAPYIKMSGYGQTYPFSNCFQF